MLLGHEFGHVFLFSVATYEATDHVLTAAFQCFKSTYVRAKRLGYLAAVTATTVVITATSIQNSDVWGTLLSIAFLAFQVGAYHAGAGSRVTDTTNR
jgi:hypothetical protein